MSGSRLNSLAMRCKVGVGLLENKLFNTVASFEFLHRFDWYVFQIEHRLSSGVVSRQASPAIFVS